MTSLEATVADLKQLFQLSGSQAEQKADDLKQKLEASLAEATRMSTALSDSLATVRSPLASSRLVFVIVGLGSCVDLSSRVFDRRATELCCQ